MSSQNDDYKNHGRSVQYMDHATRNAFVLEHSDVVRGEAAWWVQRCLRFDTNDLYQMGMLYLLEQAEKLSAFDNPRAVVRTAIRRHFVRVIMTQDSPIRVPASSHGGVKPHTVLNLGYSFSDDGDLTGCGLIPAPVDGDALERECLHAALANLSDLERRALELRFQGCGNHPVRGWSSFCKDMGVPQSRARALVAKALETLRWELVGEGGAKR